MGSDTRSADTALLEQLRSAMRLRQPSPEPVDPTAHREAAVLVLIDPTTAGLPVLFMLRSDRVSHHRSQIGFPGGSADPGDADASATALREAHEEMGIRPEQVQVLGVLSPLLTVGSYRWLTPVVGLAREAVVVQPDPFEVEEWFRVGLVDLLRCPHSVEVWERDGRRVDVHFYHCGERVIWGATGRIVHELVGLLGRVD